MKLFRDKFLEDRKGLPLTIYDIGSCDVNGSYRHLFAEPGWTYCGVDLEAGSNVDLVIKNPYHWREIKANSADVIVSGQAFEHIEYFWLTALEVYRVLKPGGLCCLIAPSSGPEHRFPVDCWRFYADGFTALARFASLHKIEVYTQTDGARFPDGSKNWKDTVFVGQKQRFPFHIALKTQLKHFLLRRCMTL
ncbi:MAG: methyltransferase domain-containing protein [Deltaproteobacteria bacterium]|nr:methyltransferase domain-containing protein [Deltaproteobacteria bacterium]